MQTPRESDNINVFQEKYEEKEGQIFVFKIVLRTLAYALERVKFPTIPFCLAELWRHSRASLLVKFQRWQNRAHLFELAPAKRYNIFLFMSGRDLSYNKMLDGNVWSIVNVNFENDDHANEAKKKKENSRVQWLLPGRCTFNRTRSKQTNE